jgi:hypothetical protein
MRSSLSPSFRSPAHAPPLSYPRQRALGLAAVLLLAGCAACSEGDPADPLAELSDSERQELDAFIETIREAYTAGNRPAVSALINRDGMPDFLEAITSTRYSPKGPTKVVSARVEPLEGATEMVVRLRGVDYGLNVDPVGMLVLELDDVSIGKMTAEIIVGRSDGRYQLAGLKPIE